MGFNSFTRVCWPDLKWPAEDVSSGPSQLGRSVSVREVRSYAPDQLWREGRVAVSPMAGGA